MRQDQLDDERDTVTDRQEGNREDLRTVTASDRSPRVPTPGAEASEGTPETTRQGERNMAATGYGEREATTGTAGIMSGGAAGAVTGGAAAGFAGVAAGWVIGFLIGLLVGMAVGESKGLYKGLATGR
jgi:uncharacterized NAD-dependent epimerase/dehydratase family protein